MATKVQAIYVSVLRPLLEPDGLELGLISEANIINQIGIVIQDFIEKAGLIKGMACQQALLNQGVYTGPNKLSNVDEVFYDQSQLFEDNTFQISNADYDWDQMLPSNPEKYREDELLPKRFGIYPKPQMTGPQFATNLGNPFYGTVANFVAGSELTLTPPSSGYGVISKIEGPCYFDTLGGGFGTLSGLSLNRGNIMQVGTIQPTFQVAQLEDIITQIPDSFLKYIRYGVLQRIFENDAELKDTMRAKYCARRYREGIAIASAVNREIVGNQ